MIKNNRYQYHKMTTFPKSAINGLTKKLASFRFGRYWMKPEERLEHDLKFDSLRELLGLKLDQYLDGNVEIQMFDKPKKITREQTQFGKAWLKDYFFKLDGSPRSGKRTEFVSDRVLAIAKSVSRFEFVGVAGLTNGMGEVVQYIPIYRTYNRKGEYFDYAPIHWGQPIIMEGY